MKSSDNRFRTVSALGLSVAALGLIACGDDDSTTTSGQEAVSADQAVVEIGEVRSGLSASLAAYESGDADQAEELASTAYLEHFELVEGPLGEADPELTETLEELIREELRDAIKAGEPEPGVAALIEQAQGDLNQAEQALQGSG